METQEEIVTMIKGLLLGHKIIDAGLDFIQMDDGRKIYVTKKEMKNIIGL